MGKVDWQRQGEIAAAARQKVAEEERQQIRQEVELSKRAVAFAATPVFPGESEEEFEALVEDLRIRYEPADPVAADAVQTLAMALWRKRNLSTFRRAQVARMRFGHHFRYPGDQAGYMELLAGIWQDFTTAMEMRIKGGETANDGSAPPADQQVGNGDSKCERHAAKNAADKRADAETGAGTEMPRLHSHLGQLFDLYRVTKQLDEFKELTDESPPRESELISIDMSNQIQLAMLGDLVTPERLSAELRMIAELDRVIESSHRRLMRLKAEAERTVARPRNPPLPPWRGGRN